jgi:hypothetical protein
MVIAALMLIVPSPAPDIRRRTPAKLPAGPDLNQEAALTHRHKNADFCRYFWGLP